MIQPHTASGPSRISPCPFNSRDESEQIASEQSRPRICHDVLMPSDEQIEAQIEELESERERLREREGSVDPTLDQDVSRIEEIRVELDRLWDFLRQRRALRSAGEDPDTASERSAEIVEKYWQ